MAETKFTIVRNKLEEIRCPLYAGNTEDALRDIYQELVSSHGAMVSEDSRVLIRQLVRCEGAVCDIARALKPPHVPTPSLIHRAFAVLGLFSQAEASLVAAQGGFELILKGMKDHLAQQYVQEARIVALVELGRSTEYCQLNGQSIVERVVEAMEAHMRSSQVFYLASKSLKLICQLGVTIDEEMALRVQGNLMNGIFIFLLTKEEASQQAGREALSAWVGDIFLAKEMIAFRATMLCNMDRILRMAMGLDTVNHAVCGLNDDSKSIKYNLFFQIPLIECCYACFSFVSIISSSCSDASTPPPPSPPLECCWLGCSREGPLLLAVVPLRLSRWSKNSDGQGAPPPSSLGARRLDPLHPPTFCGEMIAMRALGGSMAMR